MSQKIIQQGAEAIIIKSDNFVIKDRVKKSYRIKELDDKIRKSRTKKEAKLLIKASEIISSPKPFFIREFYKIKMPFIDGKKLSEHLDNFELIKQKQICNQIGESIAKLHDGDIIHGDLTTSNMILVKEKNIATHLSSQINKLEVNNKSITNIKQLTYGGGGVDGGLQEDFKIYFIDFGLGFISKKFEDKAVDLHLLRQALEAKHFKNWEVLFNEIIKGYKNFKDSKTVLERLKAVEKRGRYKRVC